jgi:hypothetical protein
MTVDDYRDFRLANPQGVGNDKNVRAFITARDQAEAEAAANVKPKMWIRNPNFVRFDQMPSYQSEGK